MRTFVSPDFHGRHALAEQLLERAGVPLSPAERVGARVRSVQVGDLIDGRLASLGRDLYIAAKAREWYDVVLFGNHEHPYWDGPRFENFTPFPELAVALRRLERETILQPCLRIGETLVTHAGVTPDWGFGSAAEAELEILTRWATEPRGPLFAQIGGMRDGSAPRGGILWSDWQESRSYQFSQVHGHTPLEAGPASRVSVASGVHVLLGDTAVRVGTATFCLNIDCKAKAGRRAVGVWLDAAGRPEETVEVLIPDRPQP